MTDKEKDKIKVIDINDNNFFDDADSYFEKSAKSLNSDGFLTKLVIVAVLLSFVFIGIVVFAPLDKLNNLSFDKKTISNELAKSKNDGFNLFKKRENILLLGVDSNGDGADPFEGTRTDTIMLVTFDKGSKSASVISIPRDSKVYIGGHGIDKINSAHAVGGIDETIRTVQDMFGVKIDHYVLVNNAGLKEIVKIFGTIPVTVEKRLRYRDYAGHLFVNLDPGKQELNAEQVEQFVRFRHDAVGDIGRMERQRMLMKGLVTKLQSPESISKLPEVISTASKYVQTDMNVFDMTRYAGIAKSMNLDDVMTATLPGHPSQNSSVSYWILEPDKVQNIINRLVYHMEEENPYAENLKISLLYDEATAPKLEPIKEVLKENGMEVVCERETKKTVPEVIVHSNNFTSTKYKYLKTILPQLKPAHMTISYDLYYCGESDATLILTEEK
ncbi:MAG: LCP family protein [Candidatus Gastranaerophilales bacterium]|nr:LCP family protein [Candidatus Gastranaerophilales bacterium]